MNWSKPTLLRDFTLLAALIVFALAMVSAWVTYETYLDQSQQAEHQLETEATRIDRAMIIEIEHASYLLEGLGRQITHMDTHNLNSIAQLLKDFDTAATQHHVFSWIDENQNNVVSSNSGVHPKPIDVSDRDFVKLAIADPWKIQIGRPIEGRVSQKWVLPVALGLTDETGRYIGTILISMNVNTITHDLDAAVKQTGISFAIYSNTLLPLTQRQGDIASLLDSYSAQLKPVDLATHPSGILSRIGLFSNAPLYVYYEVSAQYPYVIMLGLSNSAATNSIRSLLVPRLMQILMMGVFMLTLLWLVRLRVLRPVADLTATAANMLRGAPYREPESSGAGEVRVLGQQVKRLGDYIHEMLRTVEEQENRGLMLRKAKDAAEFSNKIKTEFLTAMSHELRTPLNTIVGFSEIIKTQMHGSLENNQYQQYAQNIHEASRHLQSLVDDVLALSNAEAGMLDLQEKSVDVRFVLNKCLRMINEKMQEHKLQVELKIPDVLPRLLVDEQRLRQIIVNLILNAAHYSAENSHIIVSVYLEKDKSGSESFCISFIDFGTKHAVAKTDKGKTKKSDMSNLGIPLTKALVAMHRAKLDIESPPGKPTSVILRFPQERIVY